MQILDFSIPKEATSIWDKHVPIVIDSGDIHIYITDEIIDPANYNEVYHILNNATSRDRVFIYLNTPGGYLDTAYMLVNAIKDCSASTQATLTGTVASAGTIIALACDFVVAKPHSAFMIHNYSAVVGG